MTSLEWVIGQPLKNKYCVGGLASSPLEIRGSVVEKVKYAELLPIEGTLSDQGTVWFSTNAKVPGGRTDLPPTDSKSIRDESFKHTTGRLLPMCICETRVILSTIHCIFVLVGQHSYKICGQS